MKLTRIAPIAALGLASASLAGAGAPGPRAALLEGTWNLELLRQGCDDVTREHRGELWIFGADGRFERVSTTAGGTSSRERGRYTVQYRESELSLVLDAGDGGRHGEAYPILSLDDTRMELLSPTVVKQGVVIKQERYAAFFHS